ncbi:MAG: glutathione S-transferase family protein, partial [Paracoccaceae bacterium]|nr:glutathione S-transferase family protein [Paracoccaceae bacterium]
MLKVWGRKTSSNVQALMWGIGELGLPYDRVDIGHVHGGTDTPEFLALNPNRTVPVLQDGDGPPIWETGAILRYLASRYAPDPFWPKDIIARADVDKWAEWAKLNIASGFGSGIFWRVVRTPAAARDTAAITAAIAGFETLLAIAEARLTQTDFLVGDHLTLADIQFGHVLYRYYDIDIPRGDFPAVKAYYDRLCTRAPYRSHVMV